MQHQPQMKTTTEADFMRNPHAPKRKHAADADIATIRENARANAKKLAAEKRERTEDRRTQADADREHRELVNRVRDEIARGLGATSGEYILEAIEMHAASSSGNPALAPIWHQVRQITYTAPNIDAAIEARHALTFAFDAVPPGTVCAERAPSLTRLPAPKPLSRANRVGSDALRAIALAVGIDLPAIEDLEDPDLEDEDAIEDRIEKARAQKLYDPEDWESNDSLAAKDLAAAKKERAEHTADAERACLARLNAVRTAILAAIAEKLATLEMGPIAWWCLELYRHLADSPTRTPYGADHPNDPPKAWRITQAFGVNFDFSQIKE
jgi:hypothetical protein